MDLSIVVEPATTYPFLQNFICLIQNDKITAQDFYAPTQRVGHLVQVNKKAFAGYMEQQVMVNSINSVHFFVILIWILVAK